jgi:chemotaxis protein MotB
MDRPLPLSGARRALALLRTMALTWLGLLAGVILVTGCVSKGAFVTKSQELDMTATALGRERQKGADLERRLAEGTVDRERLAAELAVARGEVARLSDHVAEATSQRENLSRQLAIAQQATSQKDGNTQQTAAHYDALIKDLEGQREELAKRTTDLAGRLAEAESRVASLGAELGSTQQALASTRGQLSAARDELTATRQDLGQTQEQLAERERKLTEATATYDKLLVDLKGEIADGQVKITRLRDKLTVNLVDKILFDSGSIAIKPRGKGVLLKVAEILRTVKDKRIQIEGHTDNVKIRGTLTQRFPTNWELSTSRATVVARFFQEQGSLNPARLVAAGYGDHRPVASNGTPAGRAENRRIEIVLLPLGLDSL